MSNQKRDIITKAVSVHVGLMKPSKKQIHRLEVKPKEKM
jgi:hypothetical protein